MLTSELIKYWEWSARQYWQYQRRGSWKYAWHGDTLVRYVECAPADPDFTAGLLEYLKSPESVHGFEDGGRRYEGATVYNRPAKLEEAWKPVSAWYEQQEGQVDERTKLKVIRVYQALQKSAEDAGADGPYVMENGCWHKVTFTYGWKRESLPAVPQGSSGVSYSLEQVSRDDETGLWNYCEVKRERVQQNVPEYTAEKTVFETKKEKQYHGVKADSLTATGSSASGGSGKLVKRRVMKNEDCTYNIVNETVTEEQETGAAKTVERTLRAEIVTTEDRNMPSKLAETGLKVGERVRNEKTPGGRWNRQKTVTTPKPPAGSVRETCRKTVFEHVHSETVVKAAKPSAPNVAEAAGGMVKTATVRAMDDGSYESETEERKEIEAKSAVEETRVTLRGVRKTTLNRNMKEMAKTANMKIGGVVRNERTEGGLWNQTIEEVTQTPTGKIDETCRKTALNHVHQTISNVAERPNAVNVADATDGVIRKCDVRRTEEGTFDVTDELDTAIEAETETIGGSVTRTETRKEFRNKTEIATPEVALPNVEVSAQARKNEYGLLDGVVTVVEHMPGGATVTGGSAGRTVTVESGINQMEPPDGGTGAVNEEVDVDVSLNDHGSMTTRKRTVTYHPNQATATGGSAGRTVTVESGIHQESPPEGGTGAVNEEVDVDVSLNDHGSMTTRKRTVKYNPNKVIVTGGSEGRTVEVESGIHQEDPPDGGTGAVNEEVDVDVSLNDHGSMTTRRRKVTYKEKEVTVTGGTELYSEETTSAINKEGPPENDEGGNGRAVTLRAQPNEHGSFSTTKTVRTAKAKSETKTWTTKDDNWEYAHTLSVYRNSESVPEVPSGCYQANISLSINEFGRYDAVVTSVTRARIENNNEGQSESTQGRESRYIYYQKPNGRMARRKVTAKFLARIETPGKLHTIMLDGAESGLGFNSHDNGRVGVKYTNINVEEEEIL